MFFSEWITFYFKSSGLKINSTFREGLVITSIIREVLEEMRNHLVCVRQPYPREGSIDLSWKEDREETGQVTLAKFDSDFVEYKRRRRLLKPRFSKNFQSASFERHFYRIYMSWWTVIFLFDRDSTRACIYAKYCKDI